MLEIKKQLYDYCIQFANERVHAAEQAIISAQQASADDTKSSAGDKYETTREMMQQEISRNLAQLHEAKKLQIALRAVNYEKQYDAVQSGSLVKTNQGTFFIAISAGQLLIDHETYFIISAASPMGKALNGLKLNNTINFNNKQFTISKLI